MTLDLSGVVLSQVTVAVSPLAELQACLHALAEPDHHFGARVWLERVGGGLSGGLRSDLRTFAPLWARRRSRVLLPLERPVDVPLDVELARVAAIPDGEFLASVAGTVHGASEAGDALLAGGEEAYVRACDARSFTRGELARRLVADPVAFRDDLLHLLGRCREEFFDAEWRHLAVRLGDEVTRITRQRPATPVDLLCIVSPGARAIGDTSTVRFDKLQQLRLAPQHRPVLLVPTVLGRPHLIVRGEPPFPVVVQFPVLGQESPEHVVEVRRRLSVISDANRLELCRHLVNEAITTTDLAHRTGMPVSQVSRHLAKLRSVGLLTSERDGRHVHHRLDVATLMQLGPQVISSIVQ
ncbi:DNA-binding transcriptional regulator, ArsR family [Nocardioides exalbidus]|uniref:DNA-binding transcriptional regulator, ArsR family n=1 Tax=Nocardioides exalbidus TaxID=402596 RepID=A0A1H4Z9B0_9ACTN|nr:DNA-binding transcriptional regulator, ArsR family [Nocardioides exalbidus]